MTQYIDKTALVAEIKRRIESNAKERYFGILLEDNYFLDFLNTLEVKEVDLEEEINNYFNRISHFGKIHLTPEYDNIKVSTMTIDGFASIAKHFFELGLKAQKGE